MARDQQILEKGPKAKARKNKFKKDQLGEIDYAQKKAPNNQSTINIKIFLKNRGRKHCILHRMN